MGKESGSGSERPNEFRAYLSQDWKLWVTEYPELATSMGLPGLNDRWTDDSEEGIERRRRHLTDSRSKLQRFDRAGVAAEDRLSFDLYRGLLETAEAGLRFGHDPLPFCFGSPRNLWMPLHQLEGIHILASDMAELQPRGRSSDYGDLLARLRTLPDAIEQNRLLLEKGLALGYSPPRVAMVGVPDQIANLTPEDPFASPLLKPFSDFPAVIGESERSRLRAEARKLFVDGVAPALGKLRGYLQSTYVPGLSRVDREGGTPERR